MGPGAHGLGARGPRPAAVGRDRPEAGRRAAAMADLMVTATGSRIRWDGWVDEDAWTELIRDHLAARKGHTTQQRMRTDPITSPSLR